MVQTKTSKDKASVSASLRAKILAPIPLQERRIQAAGISTAVLEGGDGPPLILLHGPGEFGATWTRVIPDLIATNRVIVPDLPGHGASEVNGSSLDPERVLDWLDELITETCSELPVLSGHLFGGAIALRFVTERHTPVARLVLVDSFGLGPLRPSPRFALPMIAFLAHPTERTQERLFRRCFVDLEAVRAEMDGKMEALEAYALDRALDANVKDSVKRLMKGFGKAIPEADLASISIPTAMIWGRDDLQVNVAVAEKAARRFGWPLHVIDDCADDPVVEQPAAFMQAWNAIFGNP